MNNGHILHPAVPQQAQAVLATPLNDAQLIALIAAHASDAPSAAVRVRLAVDIVAETVVNGMPRLAERVRELRQKNGS